MDSRITGISTSGPFPKAPMALRVATACLIVRGTAPLPHNFEVLCSSPGTFDLGCFFYLPLAWALVESRPWARICLAGLAALLVITSIRFWLAVLDLGSASSNYQPPQNVDGQLFWGAIGIPAFWILCSMSTNRAKGWFHSPKVAAVASADRTWALLLFTIALGFALREPIMRQQSQNATARAIASAKEDASRQAAAAEDESRLQVQRLEEAVTKIFTIKTEVTCMNAVTGEALVRVSCTLPSWRKDPARIQKIGVSSPHTPNQMLLSGFSNEPAKFVFKSEGFDPVDLILEEDSPERVTLRLKPTAP